MKRIFYFYFKDEVEVIYDKNRKMFLFFVRNKEPLKIQREDFLMESASFSVMYQDQAFEVNLCCHDIYRRNIVKTNIYIDILDAEIDSSDLCVFIASIKGE